METVRICRTTFSPCFVLVQVREAGDGADEGPDPLLHLKSSPGFHQFSQNIHLPAFTFGFTNVFFLNIHKKEENHSKKYF